MAGLQVVGRAAGDDLPSCDRWPVSYEPAYGARSSAGNVHGRSPWKQAPVRRITFAGTTFLRSGRPVHDAESCGSRPGQLKRRNSRAGKDGVPDNHSHDASEQGNDSSFIAERPSSPAGHGRHHSTTRHSMPLSNVRSKSFSRSRTVLAVSRGLPSAVRRRAASRTASHQESLPCRSLRSAPRVRHHPRGSLGPLRLP